MEIKPVKKYKMPAYAALGAVAAAGIISGCSPVVLEGDVAVEGNAPTTKVSYSETGAEEIQLEGDTTADTEQTLPEIEVVELDGDVAVIDTAEEYLNGYSQLEGDVAIAGDSIDENNTMLINAFSEKGISLDESSSFIEINGVYFQVCLESRNPNIAIVSDIMDEDVFDSVFADYISQKIDALPFGCLGKAVYENGDIYDVVFLRTEKDEKLTDDDVREILSALEESGII